MMQLKGIKKLLGKMSKRQSTGFTLKTDSGSENIRLKYGITEKSEKVSPSVTDISEKLRFEEINKVIRDIERLCSESDKALSWACAEVEAGREIASSVMELWSLKIKTPLEELIQRGRKLGIDFKRFFV